MSYQKQKINILLPRQGYNNVAKIYKKFYSKLDSFDNGIFSKFLPRNLTGLNILDIGAGDGRLYKFFVGKNVGKYVACDISEQMLKNFKGPKVEKIVCDVEKDFYFQKDYFDIVLCFFIILHLQDIEKFFTNVYNTLKKGGIFIVLHHIENRPYVYNINGEKFIIKNFVYRYEYIEKVAKNNFFDINNIDLKENGNLIGKIYCFTKN